MATTPTPNRADGGVLHLPLHTVGDRIKPSRPPTGDSITSSTSRVRRVLDALGGVGIAAPEEVVAAYDETMDFALGHRRARTAPEVDLTVELARKLLDGEITDADTQAQAALAVGAADMVQARDSFIRKVHEEAAKQSYVRAFNALRDAAPGILDELRARHDAILAEHLAWDPTSTRLDLNLAEDYKNLWPPVVALRAFTGWIDGDSLTLWWRFGRPDLVYEFQVTQIEQLMANRRVAYSRGGDHASIAGTSVSRQATDYGHTQMIRNGPALTLCDIAAHPEWEPRVMDAQEVLDSKAAIVASLTTGTYPRPTANTEQTSDGTEPTNSDADDQADPEHAADQPVLAAPS